MIEMRVSELISELKKMPGWMKIGVSMGDNSEGEVAGWPSNVGVELELDMDTDKPTGRKVVVIHC